MAVDPKIHAKHADLIDDDGTRLRRIVERIERLEEEKAARAEDIRAVKKEAKSAGFDVAALNEVLKRRKKDRDAVRELDELVDLYEQALSATSLRVIDGAA